MAAVFPSVLNQDVLKSAEGAKVGDFHQYLDGTKGDDVKVVQAHGYKEQSGWYAGLEHALECISALTGCDLEDISCHDRHALQQLIRGPFRSAFSTEEEKKIIGVPPNFKHGILTLPHVFAPRVDAAVHLRCQFKHFEWLVGKWNYVNAFTQLSSFQYIFVYQCNEGKEDTAWAAYVQEVDEWLNSTDFNKGQALFKEIEAKIMAELGTILAERKSKEARRRLLTTQYIDTYVEAHRKLSEKMWARPLSHRKALEEASGPPVDANFTQLREDLEHEHEVYHGAEDSSDRVYVYLAADNERVKEGLAQYLLGHTNISVMRVHTGDIIVHAKNTGTPPRKTCYLSVSPLSRSDVTPLLSLAGYLKQTSDGVMALVVDWYALSLANVLFAWRRDTDITSTFARVSLLLHPSVCFISITPLSVLLLSVCSLR